jgi:N-acetylated-alpha-linked acidic dipeptidase
MRKLILILTVVILGAILIYYYGHRNIDSFSQAAASIESFVSADRIQKQMTELASKPHRAGTQNNREVGDSIIRRLKSAGLEVTVDEFSVELPEPVETNLELVSPEESKFTVKEKAFQQDPYSAIASTDIPYFAFSPDADLEAEVVYANFGSKSDFQLLKQNGIDVTGKIALVRAQGICRGMKLWNAEETGLAGLLLFPELRDQGFNKAPYPHGPHINPWVIQRGSMLKFFQYPGEPMLETNESTLPKIPSMPISQEIAIKLLNQIHGIPAPNDWKGWLQAKYEIGVGPAKVRFRVKSDRKKTILRNIIAILPGKNQEEPILMVGGHYDAWVYGAADPSSGTTVLLEAAEALANLSKDGWTPARSILFTFWDAEEFGLFGSTKWVEDALQDQKKIMAYINVDTGVKGQDFAGYVVPGLQGPLDRVLAVVKHPSTGEFLSERRGEFVTPGFSDDTGPFTGIAGIPVAEIHFGRYYPMYHSLYDDLSWFEQFDDPEYRLSAALAKVLSLYVVKLAGDAVFPYHFAELSKYARDSLSEMIPQNYDDDPIIQEKLKRLNDVLEQFGQADQDFQTAASKENLNPENTRKINDLVWKAITSFVNKQEPVKSFQGYATRNTLLGPSEEDGCAGQPLPGLQRAVQSKDVAQIAGQLESLTESFAAATGILNEAKSILEK